ncbi:VOC family protein [soil metagenome]
MRRSFIHLIAACGIAVLLLANVASAQVRAVESIGMTVDDMDRSVDFYTRVLDFKKISDDEIAGQQFEKLYGVFGLRARIVALKLGNETIELTEFLTPRGKLVPRDSRSNDRWFQHIAIVTTDMDRAYQRLRGNKVRHASTGPQRLPDSNPNAGGIKAFYFRDPDDHNVEVIYFPAGKGDPKWQNRNELFPGIDHTAIVVEDTAKGLAFYRDVLGMRVAGTSENYGTEQEHLNNVEGAHLRITGLRAESGPGVEFLEYVAPNDGRPYPVDAKANDLIAWHTTFVAADAAGLISDLKAKGYAIVTSEPKPNCFLIRDADGHFVQVVQR